tara:strand:+ start:253 stop:672 length:420 start_codon:yes stop_codon:yes gene_type:complete
MIGWQGRKMLNMSSGGGAQPQGLSLEERKEEFMWQKAQSKEDNAYARKMILEDRKWTEDMANRKAIIEQKEEAARLASLQEEQEEVSSEASAQESAAASDQDQVYSGGNMWASLMSGAAAGGGGSNSSAASYGETLYGT